MRFWEGFSGRTYLFNQAKSYLIDLHLQDTNGSQKRMYYKNIFVTWHFKKILLLNQPIAAIWISYASQM